MLLCKKIKIDVSARDAEALEFMQGKCRGLYNWWVMRLRDGERWNFAEAKRSLQESKQYDPELNQVYGKLLYEVYYRLDNAMKGFFRRVENREKPGFPRVRPRHCFFTLCYPAMYIRVKGDRLILPTGGGARHGPKTYPNIVARLTETPPERFKEVAISRDGRGNYYASFPAERSTEPRDSSGVVAFDLGVKTLATGYTDQGRFYHIGGFKGYVTTISNWTKSGRSATNAKRNHEDTSTYQRSTNASHKRSGTNNVTVCTKHRISSPTDWLKALWSLAISPSGRWS